MIRKTFTVTNKNGLNARPAAHFVQVTNRYKSKILVGDQEIMVDGKSIIGILSLALKYGVQMVVEVNGVDEETAMQGIEDFFQNQTQTSER